MHVIDVSQPDTLEQVEAVTNVLVDIGCAEKPVLTVFNKNDAMKDETALHILLDRFPGGVEVSALRKVGLDKLTLAVLGEMQREHIEVWVQFSAADGRLGAWFFENGDVLDREDDGIVTRMRVCMHQNMLDRVKTRAGIEFEMVDDE